MHPDLFHRIVPTVGPIQRKRIFSCNFHFTFKLLEIKACFDVLYSIVLNHYEEIVPFLRSWENQKNVPFGTTSTIGVRDCELFEYDREKLMIVILIIFFCRIAPQGPKIYLLTVLDLSNNFLIDLSLALKHILKTINIYFLECIICYKPLANSNIFFSLIPIFFFFLFRDDFVKMLG